MIKRKILNKRIMMKMIKINQLFFGLLLVMPTMFFSVEYSVVAQEKLFEGARTGNVAMVEEALKAGADGSITDAEMFEEDSSDRERGMKGDSALIIAIEHGHVDVVKFLTNYDYSLADLIEPSGNYPLSVAVKRGNVEIVKLLLKKGAGAHINDTDDLGETALMHAAKRNFPEVVALLLENGAFSGIENENGKTARELAMKDGHKDVIAVLDEFRERKEKALEEGGLPKDVSKLLVEFESGEKKPLKKRKKPETETEEKEQTKKRKQSEEE
jgi:Ankyrin repeats (3 copies)/Ankyrin repeat